ncbi:MAG: rfaE bifunctional protein kinase chain/domain [Saprospiraceae bacterium]|jgi:rfaE bifunctional protein kinase chain/domain
MKKKAQDIFKRFNNLKVLIIGDVMIDRYLTGNIDRISPEAPVPVVHLQEEENRLGGAANVALNVAALGATPYLCTVIGADENGEKFLNLLPQNKLLNDGIITSGERQTTTKTRILAANQHVLRVDREDTFDLVQKEEKKILEKLNKILKNNKIDVILFQDYNKGVLTRSLIKKVTDIALNKGIPTAVDPKKKNFWSYKNVNLFKPNLKEIRESLSMDIQANETSLEAVGLQIQKRLKNEYSLITLSERGLFFNDKKNSKIIPARPRQIRDVCGAGDTVIAVAACGLGLGLKMKDIAILANLAGGQVCEKVGVHPLNKDQLKEEYSDLLEK